MSENDSRFLDEAVSRGLLSAAQADDCRRILATLAEVDVALDAGDVAVRKEFLERAQVDELRRALARFRVGRYEVLERVGEGGAGVVWRARDTRLDRIVALKVLASSLAGSSEYRDRFLREARVAVTLNHVNVVRGLDYGAADGYHYFAMEFVAGETLGERLERGGPLGEAEAFGILRQVVEALRHVRSYDLIHRDVKPENVLLTPDGQVKLGDLGLAKPSLEESARLRSDAATAGTPLYMAPEQFRDPHRIDWRADAYSLGATLFHALTGRPPFAGDDGGGSVVHRQLTEAPPDPREIALSISPGAAAVTLKLLQKEPDERYASWEDLLADMEAVLDRRPPVHTLSFASGKDRPLEVWRESVGGARARSSRSPRMRFVAAAGVLAGGALAVWAGWTYLEPWTEPVPTVRHRDRAAAPVSRARVEPADVVPDIARRPKRPTVDEEKLAHAALGAAEKAAAKHPEDLVACRKDYEFVTRHHGGTAAAAEAADRIRGLTADLEAAAVRVLQARLARARELEEAGRFREAWDELDAFPQAYEGTPSAAAAAAERDRFAAMSADVLGRALRRAQEAAEAHRYDEAEQILLGARRLALPDGRAELYDVTIRVRGARQAFETLREQQRPVFVRTYQGLLELAVDVSVGAARIRATTRLEQELEGLEAYEAELRLLLEDLDALERLQDLVLRQLGRFDARALEEFAGGPAALETPLLLDLGKLEALLPDDGPAEAARRAPGLFVLALARTELAAARERLAAAASDAVAGGLRRRLEWVLEAVEANVAEAVRAARRSADDGDLGAAAAMLRQAAAKLPEDARPRVELARILSESGRATAAVHELEAALLLDDCPVAARLDLALLERKLGHDEAALEHFVSFLDTAPADHARRSEAELQHRLLRDLILTREARALVRRGDLRYRGRKDADALEAYRGALALVPDHPAALLGAGRVHLRAGRARSFDALEALTRLVVAHPDSPPARDARRLLRDVRLEHGDVSATSEKAERLGREALAQARHAEAVYHFDEALRDSPLMGAAYLGLGRAHFGVARRNDWSRRELERALRALRSLELLSPDHAEGMLLTAETLLRLRRYEQALAAALRATEIDPASADALRVAGNAYLKLDRDDEALRAFEASFAKQRSAGALLGKALVLERQGSEGAARAVLQQIIVDVGVPDDLRADVDELRVRLDPDR